MVNLLKIKDICNRKNITLKELAIKVGITEMGLQRIMKTNSTKVDTLEKIAKALEVPVLIFFSDRKLSSEIITDFLYSSLSRMLINKHDKVSDKLSTLKDFYIWEFINMLSKDQIPMYPISFTGSPEYLLDINDEADLHLIQLAQSTSLHTETPYSKMNKVNKETFSKHKFIFDGFYFQLFENNALNICDYLNEGVIINDEIKEYWNKYNEILNTKENVRI